MSDVFVAYSSRDRKFSTNLVEILEESGFGVFFDVNIAAGDLWRDKIFSALDRAKVVIVLWSKSSVQSEWVRAEADMAVHEKKILPILIDKIDIPLGFRTIHTLDLSDFEEYPSLKEHPQFQYLVKSISLISNRDHAVKQKNNHSNTPGDRIFVDKGKSYKYLKASSKTQLFLAHASADKPKLRPVVQVLIDQGFNIWIDKPQAIGLDIPTARESSDFMFS